MKFKTTTMYTIGAAMALALFSPATARSDQDDVIRGRTARGQAQETMKQMDGTQFIKQAMEGNEAEIALANLAESKSQSQEVKQFAKDIKQDHQKANQKLRELAAAKNITETPELNAEHKQKQKELEQKSGAEFDQAYAKCMLKDHAKDIQKYQQAAKMSDTQVKEFAQQTLPTLRQHLQHAKTVAQAVGVDAATIAESSKQTPESVGGTLDTSEQERGQSSQDSQNKDEKSQQDDYKDQK